MCGYEICIRYKELKHTLNLWRKRHTCKKHRYKYAVFPDDNVLRLSQRDVINGILCAKQSGSSLLK